MVQKDKYLFQILAKSDFYFILIDMHGNYTFVNDAFKNRFSFLSDEFVGRSCMLDVHPSDISEIISVVDHCMKNPGIFKSITIRKPLSDGTFATTYWDFVTINDEFNNIGGIMCIGYELTNVMNQIQQKNESIERLLHIQSHQVRSYVATINGLVNIIDTSNLNEETVFIIKSIIETVAKLDLTLHNINTP